MNSIRDEFVQEIRELEAKQASALAESFRSHFSNLDQTFETDFERYQPELRFLDFLRKQKRQEFQQAIGQAFNKYLNDQIAAWSLTAERQQEQAFSQLANRAANYAVSYTRATDKITEAVTNQIPTTIDQSTTNDQSPVWLKWLAGGTSLLTGDIVGAGMAAPGAFNWKNILVNVGTVFATNVFLHCRTGRLSPSKQGRASSLCNLVVQ